VVLVVDAPGWPMRPPGALRSGRVLRWPGPKATRSAARQGRALYVVPTYFGPRIEAQPAAFRVRCLKVDVDGTVTTVGTN